MITVSFFGQDLHSRGRVGREENVHRHHRECERNGFAVINNIRGGGGGCDSFVQGRGTFPIE